MRRDLAVCARTSCGLGFRKLPTGRDSYRLNLQTGTDAKPALRIIPRDQHVISRKNISKAALRVLYRLNEAGYAAYLVGGAVRDRVPVYANGWYGAERTPEGYADRAAATVALGYRALALTASDSCWPSVTVAVASGT